MPKLLLLEDDLSLIDGLAYSLKKQGFAVDIVRTVQAAMDTWTDGKYDLLILDVSLPDGSGFDVCKRIRQASRVPIIFLTASDEEVNVIMGLDMGGDDYITKPFKLGVLVSRVNALLRRAKGFQEERVALASGGIRMHLLQGKAYKDDVPLELTATEYRLLSLFMQNPGIVLTKQILLDGLLDGGEYVDDNTLAVYIRRLRTKIEDDPGNPQRLLTVRGMGYRWNVAS